MSAQPNAAPKQGLPAQERPMGRSAARSGSLSQLLYITPLSTYPDRAAEGSSSSYLSAASYATIYTFHIYMIFLRTYPRAGEQLDWPSAGAAAYLHCPAKLQTRWLSMALLAPDRAVTQLLLQAGTATGNAMGPSKATIGMCSNSGKYGLRRSQ